MRDFEKAVQNELLLVVGNYDLVQNLETKCDDIFVNENHAVPISVRVLKIH